MATSDIPAAASAGEPTPQPLIGQVTRDECVVVVIGPEQQDYHVHKSLLCHHSEYFRRMFNGMWKEAVEKRVFIKDLEPITFEIFVQWLYTQQLPDKTDWLPRAITHQPPTDDDDDIWIAYLTKALVFGEHYLAPAFRQKVNNFIVDSIINVVNGTRPPTFFPAAKFAFENLPENHVMKKFFIDLHCRYWNIDWLGCKESDTEKLLDRDMPPRFLVHLIAEYSARVMGHPGWWDKDLERCAYHEHVNDCERIRCKGAESFLGT